MGDDPRARSNEDDQPPPDTPPPPEKIKRERPRVPQPTPIPANDAGIKKLSELEGKFKALLSISALVVASRRRATTIDSPDYEAAYDLIVGPSTRRSVVVIITDIGLWLSGALIGFATSVYSGSGPDWSAANVALGTGVAAMVMGVLLKHLPSAR